jgi:broad specificity phosphatase PhoE
LTNNLQSLNTFRGVSPQTNDQSKKTMTVPPTLPPRYPRRLRVLVVRHGETHENVAGIIQGQLDTPLNPFGHLQATTTADYLSNIRLDRVITSPLQRARDTAQAILSKQHKVSTVQLEQDERIKERCFGVIEGTRYVGSKNDREHIEGIEERDDLLERLAGFWNELITVHVPAEFEGHPPSKEQPQEVNEEEEMTIAVVSHGAAIFALLNSVLLAGDYIRPPQDVQLLHYANCSITELIVPTILDRRTLSPSLGLPGSPQLIEEWAVKPQHVQQRGENSERTGATKNLEGDMSRESESHIIFQDLGFGRGIGYGVRWAETTHLQDLVKEGSISKVNVDELVGK